MAAVPVLNHWDVLSNPVIQLHASQVTNPILLVGDSITEGMLFPTLGGQPTLNLGFGGARLQSIASRVIGLLPLLKPRAAILMISINNACLPDNDPESVSFQADLSGLVDTICQYTRHVGLMTIVPFETWNAKFAPFRTQAQALNAVAFVPNVTRNNAAVRAVAAYYGIPVWDLNAATRGADQTAIVGTTIDQVHPSAAGYAVIGAFYANAAAQLLAQP